MVLLFSLTNWCVFFLFLILFKNTHYYLYTLLIIPTLPTFIAFLHYKQTLLSKISTTYNRNITYGSYFIYPTYTTQ